MPPMQIQGQERCNAPASVPASVPARGRSRRAGYAMALGAALLWGTLGIFAKLIYMYDIDPIVLVVMRAGIAFITLTTGIMAADRRLMRVDVRDLPFFALFGLVGVSLNYVSYFEAIKQTSATTAVILLYTAPVFVALGAAAFFGERLTVGRVAALAVSFFGCYLVAGGYNLGQLVLSPTGALLGLAAAVTYGSYTLMSKRALTKYTAWTTITYALGFGGLFLACYAGRRLASLALLPVRGWLLILALAWGPTLASYLLYVTALNYIDATDASIICMAEPMSTAILAFIILGETLAFWQYVGAALILCGVLMLQLARDARGVAAAQIL